MTRATPVARCAIVPMQPEFKYWAFISYSHADRKWGDWLFRSLEGYRVPRRIAGRVSRDGTVPRRLFPIFRDRDELPTSADLGGNIAQSLAQSRYLVVICSPRAAGSRWVNEEVKLFKATGRENRILCLIVDGEPNATDKPGREKDECFPEAVRFRVGPDHGLLRAEPVEPIAADARPGSDGLEKAKVKLLAGLLGVDFDELWQREKRRQLWRRVRYTAVAAGLAALAAGAWQWTRQVRIDGYLEAGRLLCLDGDPDKALPLLSAAYAQGYTHDPALLFLLHQSRLELPAITPDRHTGRVFMAGFSPDGQSLVTACDDSRTKIWETATGRLRATLPHPACVNSAVFSRDGGTILTAGNDGKVRLWDAKAVGTARQVAAELDLGGQVFPAIFNRQGTLIAAASLNGVARVWDATTHAVLGTFREHREAIHTLEFSADGLAVVTASLDRTARIWDPATLEQKAVLQPHDSALKYAGFSPDGTRVVTCTDTGQAGLWRSDGSLITWLEPRHLPSVRRAAFSPDGRLLVTAGGDGTARVWHGETGAWLYTLNHAQSADSENKLIFMVAFSPDGRLLASAGQDGVVKIWDMQDKGRLVQTLTQHSSVEVIGVAFSADGRWLSTAGGDGLAFVWAMLDSPTEQLHATPLGGADAAAVAGTSLLRTIPGHSAYVALARFSPDGRRIVSVDGPGRARVWTTAPNDGPLLETAPGIQMNDAVFDHAGSRLVTGDNSGNVKIWPLSPGTGSPGSAAWSFPALDGPVRRVLITPDSEHIIVAGEDRKRDADGVRQQRSVVRFFNGKGVLGVTVEGSNPVLSRDGRLVVTLTAGNRAQLWSADGRPLANLEGQHTKRVVQAGFSSDGTRIVTASEDRTAIVWDTAGHPVLPPLAGLVQGGLFFVGFSPDDRSIVIIGGGGSPAQLWDARNGRTRVTLADNQSYVDSPTFGNIQPHASFSSDGKLIVTQCFTNLVHVWDTTRGRRLAQFKGHTGTVTAVAFSPTETRLVTGSQDGTLRIWDTGPETADPAEMARFVAQKSRWKLDDQGKPVKKTPPDPTPQ